MIDIEELTRLVDAAFNEGYEKGDQSGYEVGYHIGWSEGYNRGLGISTSDEQP